MGINFIINQFIYKAGVYGVLDRPRSLLTISRYMAVKGKDNS